MTMAHEGETKAAKVAACKPQLYKGEWTEAEKAYLRCLIEDFDYGILDDVSDGTTKRKYLARMLSCEPKRISKLLECSEYNGRANYQNQKAEIGDPNLIQGRRFHRAKLEEDFRRSREDLLHRRKSAFIYSRAKRAARWNTKKRATDDAADQADPPSVAEPEQPSAAFLPPTMTKSGQEAASAMVPDAASGVARLSSPSMIDASQLGVCATTNAPTDNLEAIAGLDALTLARLRASSLQLQQGNTVSSAAGLFAAPAQALTGIHGLGGDTTGTNGGALLGVSNAQGLQRGLLDQLLLQQLHQQHQQQQLAMTLGLAAPNTTATQLMATPAPAAAVGLQSSGVPSSLIMGSASVGPNTSTAAAPISLQNLALLGGGGGGPAPAAVGSSSIAGVQSISSANAATAGPVPALMDQFFLQQQQQHLPQVHQQNTTATTLLPSLLYQTPVTQAPTTSDQPKKQQLQP